MRKLTPYRKKVNEVSEDFIIEISKRTCRRYERLEKTWKCDQSHLTGSATVPDWVKQEAKRQAKEYKIKRPLRK